MDKKNRTDTQPEPTWREAIRNASGWSIHAVKRVPLTLCVLTAIILTGILTGTVLRDSFAWILSHFGLGLPAIKDGRIYTAWVELLFSSDPGLKLSLLFVVAFGMGGLEYRCGRKAAAIAFFVIGPIASIVTLLLLWPLSATGVSWADRFLVSDLGASSSALTCWGVAAMCSIGRRRLFFLVMTCLILIAIAFLPKPFGVDHLVGFLAGVALGPPLLRHMKWSRERPDSAPPGRVRSDLTGLIGLVNQNWPVWAVASFTLANGVFSILTVLLTRFPQRDFSILGRILPFGLHQWGRSLTVAFGFVLIYLSVNLFQRKKIAWWLAASISALAILSHLARVHLWYTAAAPAATLALLIAFRKRFTVRSESTSVARGILLSLLSIAVAIAYGTIGFYLLDARDFGVTFTIPGAFVRTLREYIALGNPDIVAHTRHARYFLESLRLLGLVTLVFAVYSLFRPVAYRLAALPRERRAARAILDRQGVSSLDWFKLSGDKSFYFSPRHDCVIAYRAALSVAIGLGDPSGPRGCMEEVVRSFVRFCSDNGWSVAFHQTLPDLLDMYRKLGFQTLKIGEEAVIDLGKFESETSKTEQFAKVMRRFESRGFVFERHKPPNSPKLLRELKVISDDWLSLPGRRERGFTLGRFDYSYLKSMPLDIIRSGEGRAVAFVNEVPAYRAGEATIDLMRHLSDAPSGTMDFLLAALMVALRQEGFRTFNLGLAPFSGTGERPGAGMEERAIRQIYTGLNAFFSFKGLRNYKAKFDPVWEDRFLVYRGGPPGLVRTGLALTRITEGK